MPKSRFAALIVIAIAVGSYYLWDVRATGNRFYWGLDFDAYYDYLGRALAHGQFHLPIDPSPELLAQPNPWDPSVNDKYKMHDLALFRGRYYLYHGVGPALLLFTPWRLATGHDLPENFALSLLCFGAFLFLCGAFLQVLTLAQAKPPEPLLALMILALGICQGFPYLLNRAMVYEIAIGGGAFCLAGAFFFLALSIQSPSRRFWLALSGLMFGLAIACRPHLGLVAAIGLAGVVLSVRRSRRSCTVAVCDIGCFVTPLGIIGLGIAAYNYSRFGDPFEFGIRYLLSDPNQNRIRLSVDNVAPGLYFLLLNPPAFSSVFPWLGLAFRHPFDSPDYKFPEGYFLEPTVGALYLAPLIIGALLAPMIKSKEIGSFLRIMLASSVAVLLFLTSTGFATQRYEVDFLPLAVFVALASSAILIDRSTRAVRAFGITVLAITIGYSAVANLALGIVGPYNQMATNRPQSYVRVARWFSPIEQFRPILNPKLHVEFTVDFPQQIADFRQPLVTLTHPGCLQFLYVEHIKEELLLVFWSNATTVVHNISKAARTPTRIGMSYSPESRRLKIFANNDEVMAYDVGSLVVAPSEVVIGENPITASDVTVTERRFTGHVRNVVKIIEP